MSNQTNPADVAPEGDGAEKTPGAEGVEQGDVDLGALMARYAQGDSAAFKMLFSALKPRVYGFHLRSTGVAAAAEDLTQQTFLKLHVARRRYRTGAPVEPWLFAIAKNAQRDLRRRWQRSREQLSDEGELPEKLETASSHGAQDVFLKERLDQAIARLPEGQRDVLLLHKYQGLSMREVAEALGIGVSAAKVRAFRAYGALRKLLERDVL
jgi:RNA polymerase sigma-70 factor (ECF subfamily)